MIERSVSVWRRCGF